VLNSIPQTTTEIAYTCGHNTEMVSRQKKNNNNFKAFAYYTVK